MQKQKISYWFLVGKKKNELAAHTEQLVSPLQSSISAFNDGGLYWCSGQYYVILASFAPSISIVVARWCGLCVPQRGQNCEHFVLSRSKIDLCHSNFLPCHDEIQQQSTSWWCVRRTGQAEDASPSPKTPPLLTLYLHLCASLVGRVGRRGQWQPTVTMTMLPPPQMGMTTSATTTKSSKQQSTF